MLILVNDTNGESFSPDGHYENNFENPSWRQLYKSYVDNTFGTRYLITKPNGELETIEEFVAHLRRTIKKEQYIMGLSK